MLPVRIHLALLAAHGLAGCGRLDFDLRADLTGDGGPNGRGDGAPSDDGPTEAPGCAPDETELLWTSAFDAAPPWGSTYGTAPQLEFNGALEITPDHTTGLATGYWGHIDDTADDHTGHRMFVEVPHVLDPVPSTQTIFRFTNGIQLTQIYVDDGSIVFEVQDTMGINFTAPFDPIADRWWQLRESAGVVFFETSPNGIDWTERFQHATPAFIASSSIELAAGYYMMQSMPVGTAAFDHLVVCGP